MRKNYKKPIYLLASLTVVTAFTMGCSSTNNQNNIESNPTVTATPTEGIADTFEGTTISLSDTGIQVDNEEISNDTNASVYASKDIIYYEEGHDDTYGAGSEKDGHSSEDAAKHTVVTITQPGTYKVTGNLSYGQIAVDLGEDAKEHPEDVVTLILDNANINCTVAPGIIVYNAYECGDDNEETATKDVDTKNAGFNLILADDSTNVVNGAYVAKIYKEGTTDKLHKYDAAIESKVSFNINSETKGNGTLTVNATNEGIESGLHLTINGGNITINSSDDAINTNEDNVSVLTINGGVITCDSGSGSEGDGIDSNGYIVINGGYTIASANAQSADSGVDSDLGIYINGGTLLATGNMYDEVSSDSTQNFIVLGFNEKKSEKDLILIKDSEDNAVAAFNAVNDYSMLVYSSPNLIEGDYTLYQVSSVTGDLNGSIYTNITDYKDPIQLQYTSNSMMGPGGGMMKPNDENMPELPDGERPENMQKPESGTVPDGQAPEGQLPEGQAPNGQLTEGQLPEGVEKPDDSNQVTDGNQTENKQKPDFNNGTNANSEPSTIFSLSETNFIFSRISNVSEE